MKKVNDPITHPNKKIRSVCFGYLKMGFRTHTQTLRFAYRVLPCSKTSPAALFAHAEENVNPITHPNKKSEAFASDFYGVSNGIRTHGLQGHNLTL